MSLPQSVYVRPLNVDRPSVIIQGSAWFPRFYVLTCGNCGQQVTRFGWFGRVPCRCGSINIPKWADSGF